MQWRPHENVRGLHLLPAGRIRAALIVIPGSSTTAKRFKGRLDDLRTHPVRGLAVFCLEAAGRIDGALRFDHALDSEDAIGLFELIKSLREQGVKNIILGGESYGCSATWNLLSKRPGLADAYITANCSFRRYHASHPYAGQRIHHEMGFQDGSVAVAVDTERGGLAGQHLPNRRKTIEGEAAAFRKWVGGSWRRADIIEGKKIPGPINWINDEQGCRVMLGFRWGHGWRNGDPRTGGHSTHRAGLLTARG